MKRLLFVINSLDGGGAEKSLISLLYELEKYKNKYTIDLLLPNKSGLFYSQIPNFVNEVEVPKELYYMSNSFIHLFKHKNFNIKLLLVKVKWLVQSRLNGNRSLGETEQKLWKLWKEIIKPLDKTYDVAISYMNGYPNYYVIDKVKAKRKILWIHNEYAKLGYLKEYDNKYYFLADRIVTISDSCVASFSEVFPEYEEKTVVLENISSGNLINRLAKEGKIISHSFRSFSGLRILSIGRLVEQKNFQLAIESAEKLHNDYPNLDFKWFVIGKGELEDELKNMVDKKGLKKYFEFIGVERNPYPYIRLTDIFVQTSKFEGKSIVIDEAKILQKPIICTDYKTVGNSIENNVTGIIVKQTKESISEGIYKLYKDKELRNKLIRNLKKFENGNNEEIKKYIFEFER